VAGNAKSLYKPSANKYRVNEKEFYIEQHRKMHEVSKRFRGRSLIQHIPTIKKLMEQHNCSTILDYGCGKATCWPPEWKPVIQGYDPAYQPFSARPNPADMVICTDVMEHIPESAVSEVLDDIFKLAQTWAYLNICTRDSDKKLPNGKSVHLTVRPPVWWDERLSKYSNFTVQYS